MPCGSFRDTRMTRTWHGVAKDELHGKRVKSFLPCPKPFEPGISEHEMRTFTSMCELLLREGILINDPVVVDSAGRRLPVLAHWIFNEDFDAFARLVDYGNSHELVGDAYGSVFGLVDAKEVHP